MDFLAFLVAVSFVILDGVVLFIATVYLNLSPLRFRLKTLFVAIAVIALQLSAVQWLYHQYYRQLHDVRTVLAEHPEIDRVWLGTNVDIELEVEQVYFSIKGRPDLTLYSPGIDTVDKREFRKRVERALKERQQVLVPDYLPEYRIR